MDDFSELSEEDLQALLELGILDDQGSMLSDQLAQANAVRNRPMPQAQSNGRVTTAANPLEYMGYVMQTKKAEEEAAALQRRQEDLLRKQLEGRKTYFNQMFRPPQAPMGEPEYLD